MLDKALQEELIAKGRAFTRGYQEDDPYEDSFESDQDLKKPQPPLVRAAMRDESARIALPRDFSALPMNHDLTALFRDRQSHRVYTREAISLEQLSFLLWCTQGVKAIRGKRYATLRTVPSGGARHAFETYLLVRQVEGLAPGAYHYLPMEHALEYLHPVEDIERVIADSLSGQQWAARASVVFYWSLVPYRAEWRYGIYAHRPALMDVGHVGENLYLGCTGLGLGTCGVAAFREALCDAVFELDGQEEYIVYTAPVGRVRESDHPRHFRMSLPRASFPFS